MEVAFMPFEPVHSLKSFRIADLGRQFLFFPHRGLSVAAVLLFGPPRDRVVDNLVSPVGFGQKGRVPGPGEADNRLG